MDDNAAKQSTPVIVIGGSAGSLTAIQALFKGVPASIEVAFVVIQHMSMDHESHLDYLISRCTLLPVSKIEQDRVVEPGHIYVSLPGKYLRIQDNRFVFASGQLTEYRHHPIDYCCQHISGRQLVGLIVLSGTGHDGTEAAAAVRRAHGVVMVQDPACATYAGMPSSILEEDLADLLLPASRMGEAIPLLFDAARLADFQARLMAEREADATFQSILQLIKDKLHKDMSAYKPSTLHRRIRRRMGLNQVSSFIDYFQLLQEQPQELDNLAKDLLIGVTAFFRDREAFEILRQQVLPSLCQGRGAGNPVRAWVAGCSTGEEAYSIVMSLMECFRQQKQAPAIRVFATDIDGSALEMARLGVYSPSALAGLETDLIGRYFSEDVGGYRVRKMVRESIVFANHDLVSDPPFSKLDLVVCRNLLIYLNPANQKKLLGLFHFVLNPGGYLFLGSSENIGNVQRHFEAISKQWRIFRHNDRAPRRPPLMPLQKIAALQRETSEQPLPSGGRLSEEHYFRQIIETYGPAQILVNIQHQLLFAFGDVSPYLKVPSGRTSQDVFKMLSPSLALALRSVINQVRETGQPSQLLAYLSEEHGGKAPPQVRLAAEPVGHDRLDGLMLVYFVPEEDNRKLAFQSSDEADNWILQQLTQELNATREDLQHTIEQSRTSSEEMRAANEEVMAMNEELQSANEELESSKEELQSLNEELAASNANLDAKVNEIEQLNADLNNLLQSAHSATLLLDEQLQIRLFTPSCTRIMRLIQSDLGRPFADVVRLIDDPELDQDCARVLAGAPSRTREVLGDNGAHYLRRVLPYRKNDNSVCGVVLVFADITEIKRADELLADRARTLEWQSRLLSKAAPVLARDMNDCIIFWNRGAELLYGWSESEALGKLSHVLLGTRTADGQDLAALRGCLHSEGKWKGELIHFTKSGRELAIDSQWSLFHSEEGLPTAIVEVNSDISDRKLAQNRLRQQETMFHTMVDWTYNWEYWLDPDDKIVYMTPSVQRLTGYSRADFEATPELFDAMVDEEDRPLWDQFLRASLHQEAEAGRSIELRVQRKNGEQRWFSYNYRRVRSEQGDDLGLRFTVRDISERRQAEERIRDLAYYDVLTRLPNRRLMMDRLQQAMLAGQRSQHYSALLLIDLDQFKEVNDSAGHDVGDQLLVETARRIADNVREEDTVSRLGGDEFIVLLENLSLHQTEAITQAEQIADKVRGSLDHAFSAQQDSGEFFTTTSIGITLFQGLDSSAEVLIKQADLALYQAKDAGRNCVRFFSPEMQATIDERTRLLAAMRRALAQQEFQLFYQPQFDHRGQLIGAEALIRWITPDGQRVSPADFIPLAEKTGLITEIGHWVLVNALRQLAAWRDQPRYAGLDLSINVSARQFLADGFVEQVAEALRTTGADATHLKMELTESLLVDSIAEVVERMQQLAAFGLRFAMDDFGTGYSSLSYLKRFPFSQVKIDQSFVRDVATDPGDASIVTAVIAMAQALGLDVIAEGVEDQAQRDFLLAKGCQHFQGYLFARPIPIEEWDF